jgi:phosphate transport system substrate-binding protein
MNSLKTRALLGASALAVTSAIGANADAATIFGGGSTLFAPPWAQQAFCYDNDTANQTVLTPTGSLTVNATTASGCPNNTGTLIRMDATGSSAGEAGLFANTPVASLFGTTAASMFSTVDYGLSETSLVGADLAAYDVGTGATETVSFQGDAATYTAPASIQGLTFSTAPESATNFPIPRARFGPLVQFPVSIDPVAIAYNPTYTSGSTTFSFNIKNGAVLHLDRNAYCGIFTGAITNWNDAALTTLNAGVSLKSTADTGAFSVPIKLVGYSDSSGVTSIFTRHLAAVCGSIDYATGTATLPSSVVALFTTVVGSGGVAGAVNSTQGAMGYIGADYVLPVVTSTGATTARLMKAALRNNNGAFVLPTATAASAAFGALAPPQSNSDGAYDSTNTTSDRRDPTQWVESTASTAPLANPASTATGAYPIVGTTNFIGYTCYAPGSSSVGVLQAFLNFDGGATGKVILNNAALGQLPTQWLVAIGDTFLNATPAVTGDTAHGLDLYLATVGDPGSTANPACGPAGG